jgi:NAD/NADP transhydrogenase beta subunit
MRLRGVAAANFARMASAPSLVAACESMIGVSIAPGLIALTRMPRSLSSAVQVRTKERTAALLAL